MADDKKPYVSKELLDYLARVFPDRCAKLGQSDQEVWFAAGAAQVSRHLTSVFNDQTKPSQET